MRRRHAARLVLLGPPGSGKGTLGAPLSRALGAPHVSTGDIFRRSIEAGTPLGREAEQYLARGDLVPGEITDAIVRGRLSEQDVLDRGFVLDGYPRNLEQACVLSGVLADLDTPLGKALVLEIDEDEAVRRMLARGRGDDVEEIIRRRHRQYWRETAPLTDYYDDRLVRVRAGAAVGEVFEQALRALGGAAWPEEAPVTDCSSAAPR